MLPTTSTEEPPQRARQLRLFPPPRPLTERLGREFFLKLPRVPGVYFMYDGAGTLLYIGQSQDLRDRLGSYRHVHPDRDSRRIVRLVHLVERIEWRELESAELAIQTEKELLLKHRPRFNRASVWPAPKWYWEMSVGETAVTFSLLKDPAETTGRIGPLKGAAPRAYEALVRFAYWKLMSPAEFNAIPFSVLTCPAKKGFRIPMTREGMVFAQALHAALTDAGAKTVVCCEAVLNAAMLSSAFEKAFWTAELEVLREFFGLKRPADGAAEPFAETSPMP